MSEESVITTAQYEDIKKLLSSMQETMDRRFDEWSDDRKTINDLETRLKTVDAKVDGARDEIQGLKTKIINRVDEHLEPVTEMVATQVQESVKKELNKKSMIEKMQEVIKK